MFRLKLFCHRFVFSKASTYLKILQLTPPVTKKQLKSKYIEFAKILHPDVKLDSGKSKSVKQIKEDSEAFIQITKAYKYLNDLSDQQLMNPEKEEDDKQNQKLKKQNDNEEYFQNLSKEEKIRRTTYAYFNRTYRKSSYQEQAKKQPLYKQVPQMFIGFFLVFAFLVEWSYHAIKRSQKNTQKSDPADHRQTLQNLNFKKKGNINRQQFDQI